MRTPARDKHNPTLENYKLHSVIGHDDVASDVGGGGWLLSRQLHIVRYKTQFVSMSVWVNILYCTLYSILVTMFVVTISYVHSRRFA